MYVHGDVNSWAKVTHESHKHWSPTNNGDSLHSNGLSNDQRLTIKKQNSAGFSLSSGVKKKEEPVPGM